VLRWLRLLKKSGPVRNTISNETYLLLAKGLWEQPMWTVLLFLVMNLQMINDDDDDDDDEIACADNVSQLENLKAINRQLYTVILAINRHIYTVILRDLYYYVIRKPCCPGENRAMPPRLRYFVYFLDFEMYSASRGPPCDSVALV